MPSATIDQGTLKIVQSSNQLLGEKTLNLVPCTLYPSIKIYLPFNEVCISFRRSAADKFSQEPGKEKE